MTVPTPPTPPTPPRPPAQRWVPTQRQRISTVENLDGLPLITLRLGAAGMLEPGDESMLVAELEAAGATDLLVFSHGWNTTGEGASPLARAFFGAVPPLLARYGEPGRRVVLLDVQWPGQRWADEPIAALDPAGSHDLADRYDPLGIAEPGETAAAPPPDAAVRQATLAAFDPAHHEQVDELLDLLAARPDDSVALKRARVLIRILAEAAPDEGDGERRDVTSLMEIDDPYPDQLFADFALRLSDLGVVTDTGGGSAGFGDSVSRLWHGAQEAVRQLTYWQLKSAAATAGEHGLGPLLGRLHLRRPELGITLIGHGLGARTVSYALRALTPGTAPIRSVTLLQGAFSHFAFADKLPFDASRPGALGGLQDRVTGPVVACYSRFDAAVNVFYPLAGRAAGPDTGSTGDAAVSRSGWFQPGGFGTVGAGLEPSAFEAADHRWGALGHDGHQPAGREFSLNPPGVRYDFARPGLVGIDASRVVRHGRPPSGAHSDICHPELAWIPLTASGLC